ncbi:MAG: hypothetical protein V3T77_07790, partial [Planctomycetota bacterium]
ELRTHTLKVGTLAMNVCTSDPLLEDALRERSGPFLGRAAARCQLVLTRLSAPRNNGFPYHMETHLLAGQLELVSPVMRGHFQLSTGIGELAIAPHPRFGAGVYLENALRQICQVILIESQAFLVHAAAVAHPTRQKVHLFPGRSGSGKSTISALLQGAGGRVLSDDLVLLETRDGVRVVSTPFFGSLRDTRESARPGEPLPLEGVSFLNKSSRVWREPAGPAALATAMLLANVPFTDCFDRKHREVLMRSVSRVVENTPIQHLHFRRDLSFLPLLGWQGLAERRACP